MLVAVEIVLVSADSDSFKQQLRKCVFQFFSDILFIPGGDPGGHHPKPLLTDIVAKQAKVCRQELFENGERRRTNPIFDEDVVEMEVSLAIVLTAILNQR